jgi:hypothetical protein
MIPASFVLAGSDRLVQRTNLLSPSVALLPVFKVRKNVSGFIDLLNTREWSGTLPFVSGSGSLDAQTRRSD